MKLKTLAVATAMSFAFLTPFALAGSDPSEAGPAGSPEEQGATSMGAPQFEDLDTDGDGLISAEELNLYGNTAAGYVNPIEVEDKNEDGGIDRDEFEDAVPAE